MMKWYEGRPTIVRIRIVQLISCAIIFVYGLGLWLFPEDYTSPVYAQAFNLFDAATWGVLFMAVAVLGLGAHLGPRSRRHAHAFDLFAGICQFLRIFFVVFWTMLLFISVSRYNPGTRLGPVVWLAPALMDLASVAQVGTGKGDV